MGTETYDVNLSHSGRDAAKKRGESKGVKMALATAALALTVTSSVAK